MDLPFRIQVENFVSGSIEKPEEDIFVRTIGGWTYVDILLHLVSLQECTFNVLLWNEPLIQSGQWYNEADAGRWTMRAVGANMCLDYVFFCREGKSWIHFHLTIVADFDLVNSVRWNYIWIFWNLGCRDYRDGFPEGGIFLPKCLGQGVTEETWGFMA